MFTKKLLALGLILLLAAAQLYGVKNSLAAQELREVRIPDVYSPLDLWEPYIAEHLGIFAEEGIKPVFTGVIPAAQAVHAVLTGTNDVGPYHINRTIAAIQAGAKIKMVVAGTESSKAFPHMTYIELEETPIKTPTDLFGARVGVPAIGGCMEYTPYDWLAKNGVADFKGKFTFVMVPPGTEELALRNKEVDVYGSMGTPVDIMSRGGIRVLFDDVDVWGTVGGNTPWYFSTEFIEKNPETVRRFVKAIARTQDWINEHPEEAARIQGERVQLDPKRIAVMRYAEHGIIKADSVEIWLDVMRRYGELTRDLSLDELYTNEFNEYAGQHTRQN
jgi:ABC-type nitrate/sulfonate/bicarbonate transport system substrate-binding protein